MTDFNPNSPQMPVQAAGKPAAITVFGVLNVLFGCYFLVRIINSWYRMIPGIVKNPEKITLLSGTLTFFLVVIGFGMVIWLIVLGAGLLKMKRWARRGSIIYAWIQVVFIVVTLGAIFISSIIDWQNFPRVIRASINLNNALAVIHWIYMILLLIFMQTDGVKQAFQARGQSA